MLVSRMPVRGLVMSRDDAILVCSPVSYFADDVHGVCACGAAIVWRPNAPRVGRRVCVTCAGRIIAAEPDARIGVTEEQLTEWMLYHAQTKGRH